MHGLAPNLFKCRIKSPNVAPACTDTVSGEVCGSYSMRVMRLISSANPPGATLCPPIV